MIGIFQVYIRYIPFIYVIYQVYTRYIHTPSSNFMGLFCTLFTHARPTIYRAYALHIVGLSHVKKVRDKPIKFEQCVYLS
jgi:hypothetical protein